MKIKIKTIVEFVVLWILVYLVLAYFTSAFHLDKNKEKI